MILDHVADAIESISSTAGRVLTEPLWGLRSECIHLGILELLLSGNWRDTHHNRPFGTISMGCAVSWKQYSVCFRFSFETTVFRNCSNEKL